MLTEDFIIEVYCRIDDLYRQLVGTPLRARGFAPKLTDVEIITMETVGESLGCETDKGIWRYFHNHWHDWFPDLGSRANFVKQSANLWAIKQEMQIAMMLYTGGLQDDIHIVDGFPMPVCNINRAARCRIHRDEASFSYCAAKDERYYGFEGHIVISSSGLICGYTFASANIDERDVVYEMVEKIRGKLLADKGYIRSRLKSDLAAQGIDLQTPLRKNMEDTRPKEAVSLMMSIRRMVETVIGQLAGRFHIEKVWARDIWHLSHRFIRKILAHTMMFSINKDIGNQPSQLDELLSLDC
jgi:hypothetical protein